jgi:hypothetical protein
MIHIQGRFTRDETRAAGESCCGLSHAEYRALIVKRALRSGPRPDARAMLGAKRAVDRAVERAGLSIEIPGARPGRRTI